MSRLFVLLCTGTLLAACGLKGNLYLPDKSTPVVTTTSSQNSSSSSSSESSAP